MKKMPMPTARIARIQMNTTVPAVVAPADPGGETVSVVEAAEVPVADGLRDVCAVVADTDVLGRLAGAPKTSARAIPG